MQRTEAESRLVHALRAWDVHSRAHNADHLATVQLEIQDVLECFICECLAHDPSSRLRGWWSDGVTHLRIENQSANDYKLRGTTWIGSDGIAPFDIDLTLPDNEDRPFERIKFRIGLLDENGSPVLCDPGWATGRVLDLCPRYNRDWAMAAELVPPDRSGRTT